ncbi:MAG: response regulator transcription factor [Ignavibacteriaceae bacterium]|nr:response regulator transcription factor [Ignavibacteriaceae bacterium]NUM70888.1 response regulator transcription factor [Ignavibacteriaceae bacterium]
MITISIIDDNAEYASSIASILSSQDDMICIDVITSPEKLKLTKGSVPDIFIVDLNFYGELKGLDLIREIKGTIKNTDIIVLTVHDEDEILFKALRNGAIGYLIKNLITSEKIVEFIRVVYEGGAAMSMGIARRIIQSFHIREIKEFTEREHEVLDLLCSGKSYQFIADKLFIDRSTVKFHIKNIYKKLGAANKAEALIEAKKREFF